MYILYIDKYCTPEHQFWFASVSNVNMVCTIFPFVLLVIVLVILIFCLTMLKRRMIYFSFDTKFLYRETLFHNEVSHGNAQTSTSALYWSIA